MRIVRNLRTSIPLLVAGLALPLAATAGEDNWIKDPISGCKIWTDKQDDFREVATWTGPCVDGKASGEGVLVWFKDDSFLGRYVGTMRAGRLHGDGVLHYRQPDRIEALKADVRDKTLDDGKVIYHYEGVMRDGELDGRGILYYRTNRGYDRYEGNFVNGEAHGEFTITRAGSSSEKLMLDHGKVVDEGAN